MTEAASPRILILEADGTSGDHIAGLLERQGWEIALERDPQNALERLNTGDDSPFHLFISGFKLPNMEGDDVLKKARFVSPLTQRMLMVPSNQGDLLIRAINKAEINACIVTPANDQDLVQQAKSCLLQFKRTEKHEQLKRVTAHQNKQMFQVAQRLKKRNKLCQGQICEKKAEKLLLRSKLKKSGAPSPYYETLGDRIEGYAVSMEPDALRAEFKKLADYTLALFNSAASQANLETPGVDMERVAASPDAGEPAGSPGDDQREALVQTLLKTAFSSPENAVFNPSELLEDSLPDENALEEFIRVTVSPDETEVFVKQSAPLLAGEILTLSTFLDLLRRKEISFGIIGDRDIEEWIATATPDTDDFTVALGEKPVPGQDGKIKYFFETDYTNPGKIMEDGRIDFRDRGNIPYITKGELLATKRMPVDGKEGVSVRGIPIPVEPPLDPVFIAGNGTQLSEDGLNIYATENGQPHLDPYGEIRVNPELPVNGDVNFETGNINFNGNILVKGMVKAGFTVKGIDLTANEIEGGIIDISGNLYISGGITDAKIITKGNIFAKFINNSQVTAFGDLVIQKEIIDSEILLSGQCENPTGVIIASRITAKAGIEAGSIGTGASKPAQLKVGVDDHLKAQTAEIDALLEASVARLRETREEIKRVEGKDQELYAGITEKAQVQEGAQDRLGTLKKKLAVLKKKGDEKGLAKALDRFKAVSAEAEHAEQELNSIFNTQDRYAREIERLKIKVDMAEETNKTLVLKKKGLRAFAEKKQPDPTITATGKVNPDTSVMGPNAALTLREARSRCKISERIINEDGLQLFEMEVSDL